MAFSRWGRPNKYNARPVSKAGKSFASKLESCLHDYLVDMEAKGEIKDLKLQDRVKLTEAEIVYIPDFSGIDMKTGIRVYWESKGFETEVWLLKKKLWKFYGPGPLYIFKGRAPKLSLVEVIIPKPFKGGA